MPTKWNQMLLPEWSHMANRNRMQTGRGRSFISTFPCRWSLQKWTDKAQMWMLRPTGSSIQVAWGRAECILEAVRTSQGCWSQCWVPALLRLLLTSALKDISLCLNSDVATFPGCLLFEVLKDSYFWLLADRWICSLWVKASKNESR